MVGTNGKTMAYATTNYGPTERGMGILMDPGRE